METVWNRGEVSDVARFIAPAYTIHSDPGDAWDGRTLTREAFAERLTQSRSPFPDLRFDLAETMADGDRVCISWTMHGTNARPIMGRPATGRTIAVQGMTIYYFADGLITGHRQVVDRLAVAAQLGLMG